MSPIEKAQAEYTKEWYQRGFWDDVRIYMENGCVASNQDIFLLARPVLADWPKDWLTDPRKTSLNPDCWFIQIFAGDLSKAIGFAPLYYLPFICFGRRNKFKILTTVSLTKRIAASDRV